MSETIVSIRFRQMFHKKKIIFAGQLSAWGSVFAEQKLIWAPKKQLGVLGAARPEEKQKQRE